MIILLTYFHSKSYILENQNVGKMNIITSKIIDVFSTSASRGVKSEKRNCLFYNEREMSLYENYTRSNCQMECSLKYTRLKCGCQPYFYPCKLKL